MMPRICHRNDLEPLRDLTVSLPCKLEGLEQDVRCVVRGLSTGGRTTWISHSLDCPLFDWIECYKLIKLL